MNKNSTNTERKGFSLQVMLLLVALLFGVALEATAQDYEFTLNQRRMGNQIGVEIWAKSLNAAAKNLGDMSISVEYNNDFLVPANLSGTNPSPTTDSIHYDINIASPYISITTPYTDAILGFTSLQGQAVGSFFQLDVKTSGANPTGYRPATSGRGTFVGMLKFNIINHADLYDAALTEIQFNMATTPPAVIAIVAADGSDQTNNSTFVQPDGFNIRGITILNPNSPNQAINRYPEPAYASLTPNRGYPVYWERSGLEDIAGGDYGTNRFGYSLQYSLDNGTNYITLGKVAETTLNSAGMGGNDDWYRSGEIDADASGYYITDGDGNPLVSGWGGILRTIWEANPDFQFRSEQARFRIRQIVTTGTNGDISARNNYPIDSLGRWDENNYSFALGRLFFVQLDGENTYFRTFHNYSNATQLTVEAWVNLNSIHANPGAEPGIIASSAGSQSPEEGAWLLYLSEGQYPAFRAREIEGRGDNGYLANLVAPYPLITSDASAPISDAHAENWVHIAATVENNLARLFVNGEEVARYENNNAVDIRMLTSIHPIWIGVNPNGGLQADDYLHAGIKEARVWRVALSQDQLRGHISGVYEPTNMTLGDERTALELLYPLQGTNLDIANVEYEQNNSNPLNYFITSGFNSSSENQMISYRPDRPHLRLTAPIGLEGVSNLDDQVFEVRWVAYGIGDIANGTEDVQIMLSRNGGLTWFDAVDDQTPSAILYGIDVETSTAMWEPYNNITITGQDDDLQGLIDIDGNYSKEVLLRISGSDTRNQDNIYFISQPFSVAPYFALQNLGDAIVQVDNSTALNMTSSATFIEAWIKPYRFPTVDEGYFPIISKKDENGLDYSLRLLPTGQIQLAVGAEDGVRTAQSNAHADSVLLQPNVIVMDSLWYHVAVYVNLNNGGNSSVLFYIDGTPHLSTGTSNALGTGIDVNANSQKTFYIGYEPADDENDAVTFVGELREIRFWRGAPGGQSIGSNNETSNLTRFVQGAATIRADELGFFNGIDYTTNLTAAYSLNGGSFVNNGINYSVPVYPNNSNLIATISGSGYNYVATEPYLKLITPTYKQAVANDLTALKIRWTGFDYNRNDALPTFRNGNDGTNDADLEYSILGGGGLVIQPYQYVASQTYNVGYTNSWSLTPNNTLYEFGGVASKSQFASTLNVSVTDPDLNNDGTYNDQGPIGAAQNNGRLRLSGRSTLNGYTFEYRNGSGGSEGYMENLRVESPLFMITPPSNFTMRVLLEGYHEGSLAGIQADLGTTSPDVNGSGLKISLYENMANEPGTFVKSGVSTSGYANTTTAFDPANRNAGTNDFANVNFVFTDIPDGRYFVKIDHINHLPILSRFAAPFYFSGDDADTWAIESGWDFQNWDGVASALTSANALTEPPTIGTNYTAYGLISTNADEAAYATTGLIYNDGRDGANSNQLPAMVGGDVVKDGVINALDRARVVADNGSTETRSDVTGTGLVNGDDRDIVYRNSGKASSIPEGTLPVGGIQPGGSSNGNYTPYAYDPSMIYGDAPELSVMFLEAEKNYSKDKKSNQHEIQSGALDYKVTGFAAMGQGFIDVSLYIENLGAEFGLGNSTFGIDYDASTLRFDALHFTQNMIYNQQDGLGYFPAFTSPTTDASNAIPNLRTIDINYDNTPDAGKPGMNVPRNATYLGTLRFNIVIMSDEFKFNWHPITTVNTTNGKNVTGQGSFEDIAPISITKDVAIISPNGGEVINAGRPFIVTWSKPSIESLANIEFSADNGATWTKASNEPVSLMKGSYNWITPKAETTQGLVRLLNADTGKEIDRSNNVFTLRLPQAEIIRPATSDAVYKSGTYDYIVWSLDDDVNIKFEFSANGLDGWTAVTPTVKAKDSKVQWQVPNANTKNAVVRMINVANNKVLATSSPFRILSGSVVLVTPRAGDRLKANETAPIRWIYDNVNQFDLQVSYDGGATWSVLSNDVKAVPKVHNWIVANINTKNGLIRAIYNKDPELEYSRTGMFEIWGASVSVETVEESGYVLSAPMPNPFSSTTQFNYSLAQPGKVTVKLYNALGIYVSTLMSNVEHSDGDFSISLDGKDLSSGVYMLEISVNNVRLTREVVLIK